MRKWKLHRLSISCNFIMSAEKILSDWKKSSFKPLYWLEGEEPYFIDKVVDYAEHGILTESEAGFNLTVFYGRDAEWTAVMNACKRYPMFAERQVVLLKEAQHMRDIDKLSAYFENPLPSTVFVVGYKDRKLDGRTKLASLAKKKAEYFESKKLHDSKLPEWTSEMVNAKGYEINQRALQLLLDHIGNDLSRLENEVEKVWLNMGDKKVIDENDIENYVGVSKEFNPFELQAAIAKKDLPKAIRIVQYFGSNAKTYPIQLILPALYAYFSKVYQVFGMSDKSENGLKPLFNNNYYAAKEGLDTAKNYGVQGVEKIILLLHEYNLRSVGVNDAGTADGELMKELVMKIMG